MTAERLWSGRWLLAAGLLMVVAVLTALVAAGWAPLEQLDRDVADAAHRQVLAHDGLLTTARAVSHAGDPLVVSALSLLLAVVLWLRGRRRAALAVVAVRIVAVVLGSGLKIAVDRPRPHLESVVAHASGAAFPSGHALGSAALWGTVAVLVAQRWGRWWALAVGVVVPLLVAASRVLLGVHWASDVVAGLALGWVLAIVTVALVLRPRRGSPRVAAVRAR
jgi:membrane-associated phospholipid phosphatase